MGSIHEDNRAGLEMAMQKQAMGLALKQVASKGGEIAKAVEEGIARRMGQATGIVSPGSKKAIERLALRDAIDKPILENVYGRTYDQVKHIADLVNRRGGSMQDFVGAVEEPLTKRLNKANRVAIDTLFNNSASPHRNLHLKFDSLPIHTTSGVKLNRTPRDYHNFPEWIAGGKEGTKQMMYDATRAHKLPGKDFNTFNLVRFLLTGEG